MFGNNDKKIYYVKLLGLKKEQPYPYFGITKKEGDEYIDIKDEDGKKEFSFIGGQLTSIEFDSYTYEGDEIDLLVLYLEDKKETLKFSVSYNGLAINLVNSLLNCEKIGIIKLSVYLSKKEDKNGKRYKSLSVENDGEKLSWKYDNKEIWDRIKVTKNDKGRVVHTDKTDLINFFKEELNKIKLNESLEDELNAVEKEMNGPVVSDNPPISKEALDEETAKIKDDEDLLF